MHQISDAEEKDVNDVFSDIFMCESRVIEDSYREGLAIGAQQGNVEAFHLGYHRGAEIGSEIGYYTTFTDSYLVYFAANPTGSDKVIKTLTALQALLSTFPKRNDVDLDLFQLISTIRAKFKQVCAVLKVEAPFPKVDQLSF